MRVCSTCHENKSDSSYFIRDKSTGRLHSQCKLCYKKNRSTYYADHYAKYKDLYKMRAKIRRDKLRNDFRSNMIEYMSDKHCVLCNEDDIRVLELDHLDPKIKTFSISQAVRLGYKWTDVLGEIEKCQVLCANCHKKKTAQEFGWYKSK